MKAFTELYNALDASTRTNDKIAALETYFRQAPPADAIWAIALLIGRRPKRPVNSRYVFEWAIEESGIPGWLFGECYDAVGDLSETMALVMEQKIFDAQETSLSRWMEEIILPMSGMEIDEQKETLLHSWRRLDERERFLFNKLIGGSFRVGVSQNIVAKALAKTVGVSEQVIAHRLMGNWAPTAEFFTQLQHSDAQEADLSRPYPFYLAYALEDDPHTLGEPADWQAEWKWDGIRCQLIKRRNEIFIWSRGEELVTDKYPELSALAPQLPDGVAIDGELIGWMDGKPLSFNLLQQRIGRKVLGKKVLTDVPVVLLAYDLLEENGADIRQVIFEERRKKLQALVAQINAPQLLLSPAVSFSTWEELADLRARSREMIAEGLMLKRKNSVYQAGRRRGDWWKWKVDPFTVDAVLIYAQRGSGRRASLYTDYTFGVWDKGELVPFAKAYSGLTDEEIREVDAFIRKNTLEKFGPVRTVKPELVFELAFEGIQLSTRHKSGIAVRFPRIARWRIDKPAAEADKLDDIKKLLGGS